MVKIFEVSSKKQAVIFDLSSTFKNFDEARAHFAPNIEIAEAPDYVFIGWTYDPTKEGDARFIQPTVQEGWVYDVATGTVYDPEELRLDERKNLHAETTNDTLMALRKIREGDKSYDWEGWLKALDDYNLAIEETKNQPDYPLAVKYPKYPTRE